MNRRELLREMSRVQATWVNRNTPGTGDVNIAVEDEQDYLTRIAAVFERAREEVRRKRKPVTMAAQAAAVISELLLAYDPDQPRNRRGRWTKGGAGVPTAPKASGSATSTRGEPAKLDQGSFKERPGDEDEDVSARAGDRIAEQWDVSNDDLMALAAVDGAAGWLEGLPEGERKAAYARRLIGQWNSSSGGPIPTAAITKVADRLGLGYTLADDEARTNNYIRGNEALDRATGSFGEAMYAATQAWLAERGITEVQAYRSGRGKEWDDSRPFTSWAGNAGGTKGAAGDKNFRDEVVPASRIFSVPPAGFGTMHESELVLLPPSPAVTAAMKFDPDQPRDRKGRWSDREGGAPSAPSTSRGGGKAVPVAGSRPKPSPAKVMTPEATLGAAPKDVEADTGSRKIDKAGIAALENYRGKAFTEINGDLRSGKLSAKTKATVEQIDRVHAESKLTEDVVLHRGIGDIERVFGAAAKKKLTGAEWNDDAFQSTSADADVAERFMIGEGGRRTAAVMKIRVPKGVGAIQLSDARYEAEMLLERGLRMRVISDTGPWRRGQKKPRTIEVEVVPA
jgi:ADP-ribosyltransferase exoenzyme